MLSSPTKLSIEFPPLSQLVERLIFRAMSDRRQVAAGPDDAGMLRNAECFGRSANFPTRSAFCGMRAKGGAHDLGFRGPTLEHP
jgi:hypothetical protein